MADRPRGRHPLRKTLGLLGEEIRENKLTLSMVEDLADDLLIGDYYLPFSRGGLRHWALQKGPIDYT